MKKRILIWLTVLCLLFCTCAKADGPFDWLASWLFGSKQKQETAVPSHAETVETLRALGIRVPDETVQEAETGLEEMLTMMAQYGFPRSDNRRNAWVPARCARWHSSDRRAKTIPTMSSNCQAFRWW